MATWSETWKQANRAAQQLYQELDTCEAACQTFIRKLNGPKRQGYRVTVVRYRDGISTSRWVPRAPISHA